ncbi:hypothetical protein ALI144C_37725 [Actinosynnema sp. ALI-1.44]|uniref:phosphotransferase family protein n=1 Tax=Actinosynnema sp. ALI-1.44 TaxID=1933779 RepID=UPI00097C6246|nr:phosphotransferase family protein [Actinosynnema sp. ALI-1.44]ONI76384.1 hypothetical protein ALI144C_37725 [Actinosynnema sp. ALI-1.44]
MAVPQQRDPDITRRRLAEWCSTHVAGGAGVTVGALTAPPGAGFANETLVFEAAWANRTRRMVARIATPSYQVYPTSRLAEEAKVMTTLRDHSEVPVPRVYGYEPDPEPLGGPFLVMGYVPGRVPADFPSYHRKGWVAELSEQDRAVLWDNGIATMSLVHKVRPTALGLAMVDGNWWESQFRSYAEQLDFFRSADSPVVLAALEWLRDNRPDDSLPSGLLWGDARLGNILFDHVTPTAVLDWEMVSHGPAEVDLGWFLYLDRHLSAGIGATRLAGLPGRAATITRYAELLGRAVADLTFYEVFAGLRLALVAARVTELVVANGIAGPDFPLRRNTTRLLERTLNDAERPPSSAGSAA